jgi:UDP:flavonoid glycosyltransferase YjiC (YdhE family)
MRMRLVLSTFGTAGDIIPFARLERELGRRGHEVTVHTWEHYRGWFAPGTAFAAMGGGVDAAEVDRTLDWALRAPTPFAQVDRFARLFYGLGDGPARVRAAYGRALEVFAGHERAVINVLDHVGQAAAERLGIPWVAYTSRPPPPRAQADAVFARVDTAVGELLAAATGAPRRVRVWRDLSPLRTLLVCSRHLVDAPPDPTVRITGAWLDAPGTEPLPPAIAAFLDEGPALLVTFGTMPDVNGRAAALVAAAARSGWRALVQVLPPAVAPADVPPGIRIVTERLPFAALLPRVAAVVHHGSVGTTHEVVRAGRPSFVVPHMGDQFFWGATLHGRGIAPPPLLFTELDVAALAARLDALRHPELARRAAALAPALAAEDGVAAAAEAIP